jgi:predicted RNA-binding protein
MEVNMMDQLDALKLITAYIRWSDAALVEGLAEIERSDLARIVPEMPEHVRDQLDKR